MMQRALVGLAFFGLQMLEAVNIGNAPGSGPAQPAGSPKEPPKGPRLSMEEAMQKAMEETRAEMAEEREKNKTDSVKLLREKGMYVSKEKEDEIKAHPEKVKAAMHEAHAATVQLAMYKQARCDGCKTVAQLVADALVFRTNLTRNLSNSELIQTFCESEAFPGRHQLVSKSDGIYAVEKLPEEVVNKDEEHSIATLRRMCSEDVFPNDDEILTAAEDTAKKEGEERAKLLSERVEKKICKRACKNKKGKASAAQAKGGEL